MAEGTKLPLLRGQYVWLISKKDGLIHVKFGPDPFDAAEDEIYVLPDPKDPSKFVPVDSALDAVQEFITLKEDQYAVLRNPVETPNPEYANGAHSKGKQETRALAMGKVLIITEGYFPLWPGQSVEIRERHRLYANQYLCAEVISEDVDTTAPHYDLTVRCAGIKQAVVDETVGSEGESKSISQTAEGTSEGGSGEQANEGDTSEGNTSQGSATEEAQEPETKETSTPESSDESTGDIAPPAPIFKVGQRIIIPGSLTQTYIPPTGIEVVKEVTEEVVPEEKEVDPRSLSDDKRLKLLINSGRLKIENLESFMAQLGWEGHFEKVREDYVSFRDSGQPRDALFRAITNLIDGRNLTKLINHVENNTAPARTEKAAQPQSDDVVVQNAVVLGATQFCVLVDENGNSISHAGPGRVFPGPNDAFQTQGSDNRVYDAYHLRPDRALLLRVVADKITLEELLEKLPKGAREALSQGFDIPVEGSNRSEPQKLKELYHKGDELFIGGFDAYLVPYFNTFEVIDPETRQPHIGNDHSRVYVQAIGIDQKSGVYVASVETGNVTLVKGEVKLLLDPRRFKHIKRRVPQKIWNLLIGQEEPHKKTSQSMVETPWALSVIVPNNMALLINSKSDRRLVIGPCTALLDYEEWPEVLFLSTGRPKTEDTGLETCFLRITGNRITDRVTLETKDFVKLAVDVSYGLDFIGEGDERFAWYTHKNYVWLLCQHVRSRLKGAAQLLTLTELYSNMAAFVRDTTLGVKPEEKDKARPGLFIKENSMLVFEVEVVSRKIPDEKVAAALGEAHSSIVTQEIKDSADRALLTSEKAAAERAEERAELDKAEQKRIAELEQLRVTKSAETQEVQAKILHDQSVVSQERNSEIRLKSQEDAAKAAKEKQEQDDQLVRAEQQAEFERNKESLSRKAELQKLQDEESERAQQVRLELKSKAAEAERALEEASRNLDLKLDEMDRRSEITLKAEDRAKIVEFRKELADISKSLTEAAASADEKRLTAVQDKLVEALQGLGNKELATTLAKNLPQSSGILSLFLGKTGIEALEAMAKGTPLAAGLDALRASTKSLEQEAETPVVSDKEDSEETDR